MKTSKITCTIILLILASATRSFGQADSLRTKAVAYLSQHLQTDTGTAGRVFAIQENYKKALASVIANRSLTEYQKHTAIDALIDQKNKQLTRWLPPRQLILAVPTTERRRSWTPDTTSQKIH
jgi:hypothetical protein